MSKVQNFDAIMSSKVRTRELLRIITGKEMDVMLTDNDPDTMCSIAALGKDGSLIDIRLRVIDENVSENIRRLYVRFNDVEQILPVDEKYQIFFSGDVFHQNRQVYLVEGVVKETGGVDPFSAHIFFVNMAYTGERDKELGELVHDLTCEPEEILNPIIRNALKIE